jgi:hypothetical protein
MKDRRMFFFVVLFAALVQSAAAAPRAPQDDVTASRARVTGSHSEGGALAAAMSWVRSLWESTTAALPSPPGVTNGSCVDPDGSTCHSH